MASRAAFGACTFLDSGETHHASNQARPAGGDHANSTLPSAERSVRNLYSPKSGSAPTVKSRRVVGRGAARRRREPRKRRAFLPWRMAACGGSRNAWRFPGSRRRRAGLRPMTRRLFNLGAEPLLGEYRFLTDLFALGSVKFVGSPPTGLTCCQA